MGGGAGAMLSDTGSGYLGSPNMGYGFATLAPPVRHASSPQTGILGCQPHNVVAVDDPPPLRSAAMEEEA